MNRTSPRTSHRTSHRTGHVAAHVTAHLTGRHDDERGDVPGWVLVTVMSAGIVAVLLGVAKEELSDILTTALRSVTP
ncbi:hypothetical protein [Nocardioides solisilvae]|uniref:hypothetical protein n=1 Tax=Nocardioides solisilvae TaxID=1542435 RepID=UPI000D740FAB|nr:hypothetical protein [Nocardioides solisilvae]